MRVSAIIPATDRPPTLALCLEAIRTASDGPDELIVVEEPEGIGPAAARNAGAARAAGDVLVFVDADVVVHRDAFTRIRDAFARDPNLDAVFGAYDEGGSGGAVSGFRNLLHHHVHASSPGPAATFWAGIGSIRRDAFQAHGGFDATRFPQPSIEDVELGMRMVAAGRRIELDPSIRGAHLKSWSLGRMIRTDFGRRGVPWVALLLRSGSPSTALNLGWRHRASAIAAVTACGAAVRRRPAVVLAATGALIVLNHRFYTLLYRRRGLGQAVLGLPLHVVHHLCGAAAVPAGLVAHLLERRRGIAGDAPTPSASGQAGSSLRS